MAESLVFLGAGASQPFGVPTMQHMVAEFEKEIAGKPSNELYAKIRSIQQKWYTPSNVNVESIFSVIDRLAKQVLPKDFGHLPLYLMASRGSVNEVSGQEYQHAKELKSQLEEFIKRKCTLTLSDEEMMQIHEETYVPLFENLKTSSLVKTSKKYKLRKGWKTYTTNYDTIFEGFWPDFLILDDFFEHDGNTTHKVFDKRKNVNDDCIIKLHGSLDWLKRKDGKIMKKGGPTRHRTVGEALIFPIQQKDLYLEPWINQFLHFKQALEETKEWIVIGYSFTDEFILKMFEEAITDAKQMVIINPDAERLQALFPPELQENIVPLPIKFGGQH